MGTYSLFGKEQHTTIALDNYIAISKRVDKAIDLYVPEFTEKINGYTQLSTMTNGIWSDFDSTFREAVQFLMPVLHENNVYDLDMSSFIKIYLDNEDCYGLLRNTASQIKELYSDIIADGRAEKEARAYSKATRSRWEGGGFGMEGAVKGAIQAGALNMASGALYSAKNLIGNAATDMKTSRRLEAVMENEELFESCSRSMFYAILAIKDGLIKALNQLANIEFEEIHDSDKMRAKNILEAIKAGNVPSEMQQEQLIKAWQLNPLNETVYELILNKFHDPNNELNSMGEAFFVDIVQMKDERISAWLSEKFERIDKESSHEELKAAYQSIKVEFDNLLAQYGVQELALYELANMKAQQLDEAVNVTIEICNLVEGYQEKTEAELQVILKKLDGFSDKFTYYAEKTVAKHYHDVKDARLCEEITTLLQGYEEKTEDELNVLMKSLKQYPDYLVTDKLQNVKVLYNSRVTARLNTEVANLTNGYADKNEEEILEVLGKLEAYPSDIISDVSNAIKACYDEKVSARINAEVANLTNGYADKSEEEILEVLSKLEAYPSDIVSEVSNAMKLCYDEKVSSRIRAEIRDLLNNYESKSEEELQDILKCLRSYSPEYSTEPIKTISEHYENKKNARLYSEAEKIAEGYEDKSEQELSNVIQKLSAYPALLIGEILKKVIGHYNAVVNARRTLEIEHICEGYEKMQLDELRKIKGRLQNAYADMDCAQDKIQEISKRCECLEIEMLESLCENLLELDRDEVIKLQDKLNTIDIEKNKTESYCRKVYERLVELDNLKINEELGDMTNASLGQYNEACKKLISMDVLPEEKYREYKRISDNVLAILNEKTGTVIARTKRFIEEQGYVFPEMTLVDTFSDSDTVQKMLKQWNLSANYFEKFLVLHDSSLLGGYGKGFALSTHNFYFNCKEGHGKVAISRIASFTSKSKLLLGELYVNYVDGTTKQLQLKANAKKYEQVKNLLNKMLELIKESEVYCGLENVELLRNNERQYTSSRYNHYSKNNNLPSTSNRNAVTSNSNMTNSFSTKCAERIVVTPKDFMEKMKELNQSKTEFWLESVNGEENMIKAIEILVEYGGMKEDEVDSVVIESMALKQPVCLKRNMPYGDALILQRRLSEINVETSCGR